MSLRRVPFYRVLWRGQLLFGGERRLVLFTTVVAIALPFHGVNIPSLIVGVFLWLVVLPMLRWMAKIDPQFSQVYRRQLKYQRHYEPRSRPYRVNYS